VNYQEVRTNYIEHNAYATITGPSAGSIFNDWSNGMNIYEVQAFGNTTLVGAFGELGIARIGINGGIGFYNPTAGAYLSGGEKVAASGGGAPSLLRKAWDYTYGAPWDFIGGAYDFARNYNDMRKLNLKNSDKYFHSKANFQATKRGPGGAFFAIHFSNLREIWDQRIKGDTWFDSMSDQKANIYGRELGWDYRYKKGPIDYSEVLNKYWYDYFPDGY
jgi:hypothetical protein